MKVIAQVSESFMKTVAMRVSNTSVAISRGKPGKIHPCFESGSWVALRFSARAKILNVSQRIHLRFFPALKIKYQPNLRLLTTGRFCLASLVFAAALCGQMHSVYAQTTSSSTSNTVSHREVVEGMCSNNGQLAACVGRDRGECSKMVKPLVEKCLPPGEVRLGALKEQSFERCFWGAFNKQYGKGMRYTEECFHPVQDGDPLQALPPELSGRMQGMDKLTAENVLGKAEDRGDSGEKINQREPGHSHKGH